jgi:hypothetical protein
VYKQVCSAEVDCGQEERENKYSGARDGLFFLSTQTAMGDEMGWDFVALVKYVIPFLY